MHSVVCPRIITHVSHSPELEPGPTTQPGPAKPTRTNRKAMDTNTVAIMENLSVAILIINWTM
jgi:hypothetical protein